MREHRRFRPLMFSRAAATRYHVDNDGAINLPNQRALDDADNLWSQRMNALHASPATRDGLESWYFCPRTERDAERVKAREHVEYAGNFAGWVGTGVPISPEPDHPWIEGATHEIELRIPAGYVAAVARSHETARGRIFIIPGAALRADGVIVGACRELHPAGKK
jgi:hypothetical protein